MDPRYREVIGPGSCLYEMENPRSIGKLDDVSRVPNALISTKNGSVHEWIMGRNFERKAEFAAMMDSKPEYYDWGLNDLKEVKGVEYSIELTDTKPIFARQYHLAHYEQSFAETWVKELEKAGIVRKIESPFAVPDVIVPALKCSYNTRPISNTGTPKRFYRR